MYYVALEISRTDIEFYSIKRYLQEVKVLFKI